MKPLTLGAIAKIAFITARTIASLKTQLLTRKVLHSCPRRLRPPALKIFCTQSSHGKIGKEEPWTLEIISYWSDKLSSILDYFTLVDRQFSAKVRYASPSSDVLASHLPESPRPRVLTSPSPHVPTSPRPYVPESPSPKSYVPRPRPTFSNSPLIVLIWPL